jgi:hypothetical protein
MLFDDCEPLRVPPPVTTDWEEDLVFIRVGNIQLGLEATTKILDVVMEVLAFAKAVELTDSAKDQIMDDLHTILIGLKGK